MKRKRTSAKKGIGKLLLKGLQRKRNLLVPVVSRRPKERLRLTLNWEKKSIPAAPLEPEVVPGFLSETPQEPPLESQESLASSDVTAASPTSDKELAVIDTPSPLLPQALTEALPALEAFPSTGSPFSTQDFLKPNDALRQSIEAFLMDQRSPHTRKAYGKDLKRFVQFLLSRNQSRGVETLTRTVLIAYKESLVSEKLQHTTIDRHLATLKSFFKWLVEDGVLFKSPADGVRFLSPKRVSRTVGFSDEEVKKLLLIPDLHTKTGSLHYAILMVLFYCGLRRSELCDLTTRNLGTERDQRVVRLLGKGNAERVIVMIPPVWNAIEHYFYIARRNLSVDDFLFKPQRNNRTGNLRKALDPSMIFYIVTRYSKLAGIVNRVSPHSCRATAISNARDHHVPDRAIQEFAGWASPDMITRYDKRKGSVEDSAAHSILYGAENRLVPKVANPVEEKIIEKPLTKPKPLLPEPSL